MDLGARTLAGPCAFLGVCWEREEWVAALVRRGDPKASDQEDAGEEKRERPRVGAGRGRPVPGPLVDSVAGNEQDGASRPTRARYGLQADDGVASRTAPQTTVTG